MSTEIHPTALVQSGAELDTGVFVGPYCVVGPKVKIGKGSRLESHVVLDGDLILGEGNLVSPFCAFGGPPQDLSYKGEPTALRIGHRNVFREGVSIHRGTMKDKGLTLVGNDNYLMGYCHVAHDCVLADKIIMANQTALAGHVQVGNRVTIGGVTGITQFVRLGDFCFIGAGSVIRRDIPPFMCAKEFSQVTSPNLVGLKRSGMSEDKVRVASQIYKTLYLGNLTTEKALLEIESRFPNNDLAAQFVSFVRSTKIGIQR
jgi:UDP-N-acetylglucosamine acyltransferase